MRRLMRNIGWLLGGRGFNAVLSLVYLALATRTLGLEGFGYFALIVALGQTVTGIANFQTWQFVIRWGAETENAGEATGFAIALDMMSLLLGAILATGLVYSTRFWLPLPSELHGLALCYCLVSLASIRSTPTGLLRLRFKYGLATAADAVQPIVRAAGAVLAVLYMPDVTGFILAWAASEVAVAAAYWIIAARDQKIDFSQISLFRIPRHHPEAWRFVWSTNMSGSLAVGGKQVMILLVGAIGGEAFAGGFRVASQLGQALVQLAQTVSKAIYPELVHAQDNAVAIARRMAQLALVGGIVAVGIAILFGRWGLVAIAGPEFRIVYWAMVILAVAGAIELVGASLESLLVSAGRAGTAFLTRAAPTLLAMALLPTAMEWNGLKGAAFTILGSSALAVIGFYVAVLSLAKIRITIEPAETPQPKV
ncbi:oligosaccharide flippase family protein [Altererythrobacter confluentis]|uniref:Oligosaccharide flippase family protein n=1 Tax=Allopontixanthobacter confluentis TaxID=1849021 RepID=A0A6L7GG89_9SPHN|nr:lipopolysaccharide biosynthesis protein [Allopontixanthobacter confluentis]MXP14897.1 oligosaccharide flippase family protein [Allopontixanthobacter confluentis]